MKNMFRALCATASLWACAAPAFAGAYEDAMDRFMITELMYRYAIAHNTGNVKAYADLFTDDAKIYDQTMSYMFAEGRENILKQAQNDREKYIKDGVPEKKGQLRLSKIRHNITDPVVTLNKDGTATGICYVQMVAEDPGVGPALLAQGYYLDEYVKKNGKWLISRRDINAVEISNWGLAKKLGLINGPLPTPKAGE
jgi:hypothetical protein